MHTTSVLLLSSADQEPQGPGAPGAQWAPTAFGGGRRFAPLHGKSGNTEKRGKKKRKKRKNGKQRRGSIGNPSSRMDRKWFDQKFIIEDGHYGSTGNPSSRMDRRWTTNAQIIPNGPLKDPYQGARFLRVSARNRSILEDGPDLA